MIIDVAISSCARIDILENAINTFRKYVKSKDGFRLIICEDKVNDDLRQEKGRVWIKNHIQLFDKVVISDKKLTYVYCFSEVLKHVTSPYFFRLEDDVVFHEEINVDEIIEIMKTMPKLSQLIFKRKKHRLVKPINVKNKIGRKIKLVNMYSIATGIYNTKLTNKIIDLSGTGQCHESSVLAPSMRKLNLNSGVIFGKNKKHALDCVGDSLGYMKGSWK